MTRRFALILMALTLAASAAQAAPCMRANEAGEIAEGALALGEFEDAAGRPEEAYILALPEPTCLSGSEETDNIEEVETIHVYSFDQGILARLRQLAGQEVRVVGTPFGAHTAHHHAPIVMEISQIDEH